MPRSSVARLIWRARGAAAELAPGLASRARRTRRVMHRPFATLVVGFELHAALRLLAVLLLGARTRGDHLAHPARIGALYPQGHVAERDLRAGEGDAPDAVDDIAAH